MQTASRQPELLQCHTAELDHAHSGDGHHHDSTSGLHVLGYSLTLPTHSLHTHARPPERTRAIDGTCETGAPPRRPPPPEYIRRAPLLYGLGECSSMAESASHADVFRGAIFLRDFLRGHGLCTFAMASSAPSQKAHGPHLRGNLQRMRATHSPQGALLVAPRPQPARARAHAPTGTCKGGTHMPLQVLAFLVCSIVLLDLTGSKSPLFDMAHAGSIPRPRKTG